MNWGRTTAVILGAAALTASPALSVRLPAAALPQSKTAAQKPASSGTAAKKTTPAKSTSAKKKRVTRRRRPRGQQAPNADRIKEIQLALSREGHYQGTPTGKLDAATTAALKSFQQTNGFNPTGKLDARTLQKLGLGSEVAGLAPPRATPANGDDPPARP